MESIERNEWKYTNESNENSSLEEAAKNKRINIRISGKDLNGIKQRASEEGLPYQTLISSILHKFISGSLVEKQR